MSMESRLRMEQGLVVPTVVRLIELAQLFGCELADFTIAECNRPTEQGIVLNQQLAKLDTADRGAGAGGG